MSHNGVISGKYAYPQHQYIGSTLFSFLRGDSGGADLSQIVNYQSANDGDTWGTYKEVLNLQTTNYRAYPTVIYNNSEDEILLYVRRRNVSAVTWDEHYILRSTDGNVWYNADSSYAHNVTLSGAIDTTEMSTNFRILDCSDNCVLGGTAFLNDTLYVTYKEETGGTSTPKVLKVPIGDGVGAPASTALTYTGWSEYQDEDISNDYFMIVPTATAGKFHVLTRESVGGDIVVKKYTTTDYFAGAMGSGTVISPSGHDVEHFEIPENYRAGQSCSIFGTAVNADRKSADLFIYILTP